MSENRRPPVDSVYRVLTDRRRRRAVVALDEHEPSATVDELCRWLRDGEGDDGGADVGVELHHVHLPKLVDAGVVTYDGDRVTLTEHGKRVADVVEGVHVHLTE
ncbi:MAG: ArsR family transcriptional regulator [Haloarculaceae archaeon]